MSPMQADLSPEPDPPDDSPPVGELSVGPADAGPADRRPPPSGRVWALTLAFGLVAGFASWLVGESWHDRFDRPLRNTGGIPTAEETNAAAIGRMAGVTQEATLAFGSLGAALGLALGLAGGSARRSARAALIAASFGTALGATAGAVMPRLLLPIYFRVYEPDNDDLALAISIQSGICCVIGAVGGAALGVGLGGGALSVRTLLGGLLGAIAGVLVYQVVGALAFPLDQTTKPLSATWATRLLACLTVTAFASAGAAVGVGGLPLAARDDRGMSGSQR